MVDIDVSQFRKLYLSTALEYVKKIEDHLKLLRTGSMASSVNEIFIAAHSLKSQSLIMGYSLLADASFMLEKTYRFLKDSSTQVDSLILDATSILMESLRTSLEQIVNGGEEKNITDAISEYKKKVGGVVSL